MTANKAPSDGVITGYGVIDNKLVYVYRCTVLNGTVGEMAQKKITKTCILPRKTGARLSDLLTVQVSVQGATDALEAGQIYLKQTSASGVIPADHSNLRNMWRWDGSCPSLTDFRFMESKKRKMFVNTHKRTGRKKQQR